MSVITHSYTNTVSSLYISKYHRYIEELLVSPIQNYTILAGFITGGVIRGLSVGVVVIIAAQFFCDIYSAQSIPYDDSNNTIINFILYVWLFKWLVCK